MSGLGDLNIFGFIKKSNGKTASFNNINTDKGRKNKAEIDGKKRAVITQSEWERARKTYNLNGITFDELDANGDGYITQKEFIALKNKTKGLQEVVDKFKSVISKTFSGIDALLQQDAINEIKAFIEEYVDGLDGNLTEADVEAFEVALKKRFEEMLNDKDGILANRPTAILSRVAEEICNIINVKLDPKVKEALLNDLIKVGENFIKNYNGDIKQLQAELQKYLYDYMETSDHEKMERAIKTYEKSIALFGDMIDKNEFISLKNAVEIFLTEALEKNVEVTLGGVRILTPQAITSALAKYTDGAQLLADMKTLIISLPIVSRAELLRKTYKPEGSQDSEETEGTQYSEETEETGGTQATENSELDKYLEACKNCKVDIAKLDLSKIKMYKELSCKAEQIGTYLLQDGVKQQIIDQIKTILKKSGVPEDRAGKIIKLLDSVYNESIKAFAPYFPQLRLSDGTIIDTGVTRKTSLGTAAEFDPAKLLEAFVKVLNDKLQIALNKMNDEKK